MMLNRGGKRNEEPWSAGTSIIEAIDELVRDAYSRDRNVAHASPTRPTRTSPSRHVLLIFLLSA